MAAAGGAPLLLCAWTPDLTVTVCLWMLTGLATAYQVQVAAEFVRALPPQIRGQGLSVASAGLLAIQGVGLLAGGALVARFAPSTTVAIAGATATLFGTWLSHLRRHQSGGIAPIPAITT
jgi:hypothetical protein